MSRVLVTGANGFFGSHLAELLVERGEAVHAAVHSDTSNLQHLRGKLTLLPCDVQNREQVTTIVQRAQPQVIFHLAAQSLQSVSWREPEATFALNVFGTLNLLEAVRGTGSSPAIIVAGSGAEYGFRAAYEPPLTEEELLQPASPYGVSKAAADMLAYLYWRAYALNIVRVRPFGVTGPRKEGDVGADFARGIVAVERGEEQALVVGNLDVVRDFLDVRDGVEALALLADKGTPGEVYNVCSGQGHRVGEVLEVLLAMAKKPVPVVQVPGQRRPADEPIVVGDNTKLRALGWQPTIPLSQTLASILEYWRRKNAAP